MIGFLAQNIRWLSSGLSLTFTSSFGQTYFIAIFAAEIMAHYGLTDGQWGLIYAAGTLVSGVLMIWAGILTDIVKVKWMAMCLLGGLAIFCIAMSFNNSVFLLPLIVFGLRFCGQGMLTHTAMIGMARWFGPNRGKAVAIAGLGFSLGEAFLPLIVLALLAHFVWQDIWLGAALVSVIFIFLVLWLLQAERRPSELAKETQTPGLGGVHWTRKMVLTNWMFWTLFPLTLGPSIYGTVLFFHQAHLAEIKGWAHAELASLFPIYSVTVIISMLIYGILNDRFGAHRLIAFVQLPAAIGYFILSLVSGGLGVTGAFVFIAIMQGGWSTLSINFWAEFYGTKHLGSIKSVATAIMVFGSAIGPALTGWFIDRGVNFDQQMPWMSGFIIFAACLCAFTVYRARRKYT